MPWLTWPSTAFHRILRTAAYWLMRELRDAIPATQALTKGAFSIIRPRLLKVAVRIKKTASLARLAFAGNCPDAGERDVEAPPLPRPRDRRRDPSDRFRFRGFLRPVNHG